MKKILVFAAILFSLSASAQVDSSSYTLPVQMKPKFAKLLVPESPGIADLRYIDSLSKAVGSGINNDDSVTTINIKAGTYWIGIQKMFDVEVVEYNYAVEFFTSALTSTGYSGLLTMLNYYAASGTANQKIAAIWLRGKVNDLLARKQALLTEQQANGLKRLKAAKTPVYN